MCALDAARVSSTYLYIYYIPVVSGILQVIHDVTPVENMPSVTKTRSSLLGAGVYSSHIVLLLSDTYSKHLRFIIGEISLETNKSAAS